MFINKNISIFITLLFFTTQVLAYTSMVCDMKTSNTEINMSKMDHTSHNMEMAITDSITDDVKDKDCCGDSCDCTMGGCSSTFLSNNSRKNIFSPQYSKSIISKDQFISSVEITSLNRPPIAS
jgi:hypothetical protein